MTMSVLNLAARRVLCIALVLAPALVANVAVAQDVQAAYGNYQSPINIIDLGQPPVDAPKFSKGGDLQKATNFTLKNTAQSSWATRFTTLTRLRRVRGRLTSVGAA